MKTVKTGLTQRNPGIKYRHTSSYLSFRERVDYVKVDFESLGGLLTLNVAWLPAVFGRIRLSPMNGPVP